MILNYFKNFQKKNLSVQISAIVVLTIGILGAILSALVVANQYRDGQRELHSRVNTLSSVLAHNLEAAIDFEDVTTATELLESIYLLEEIQRAEIYLADGRKLVDLKIDTQPGFIDRYIDPYISTSLIVNNSRVLGKVILHANHITFYKALAIESGGAIVLLLLLSLFAYLLSLRLHGIITKPITSLIGVTDEIAKNNDYTIRLDTTEVGGELGELSANFNSMIEEVAKRDQSLHNLANSLERMVTQRTQELTETVQSLEFTQQSVENSHELVIWCDKHGKVQYLNKSAQAALGSFSSNPEGLSIWNFDKEVSEENWKETWQLSNNPGKEGLRESFYYSGKGALFPVQFSMSRVSSGDTDFLCLIARDVTELRERERQLLQGQKLESIGQLAAGIAHEINTPTQFIGDNIQFLKNSFIDLEKYLNKVEGLIQADEQKSAVIELRKEFDLDYLLAEVPDAVDQSIDGIGRVVKIVTAMKEFAHPGVEEKVLFNINEGLVNSVEVSRNEWKYCADVEYKLADDLQGIFCYPGDLNQVFLNLIVNASHAIESRYGENGSNGSGKITIETENSHSGIVVKIRDNGCGIDSDKVDRIFDPFFTTKPVGKGTGQGLAISHSIVTEKHQGELQVDSIKGEGTTIIVSLPQG